MSSQRVRFMVRLDIKPEHAESFAAMLSTAVPATRAEPGNTLFEASRSLTNRNAFVLVEEWATQEDLDRHNNTAEHRERMAHYPAILAGPPEITPLEPIGSR